MTVSSPVRQLVWNQKRRCYLSQSWLGPLVFWMILAGATPAWSEVSRSTVLEHPAKANLLEPILPSPDQLSPLIHPSDRFVLAESDSAEPSPPPKEPLSRTGIEQRSLHRSSLTVSQSLTSEPLNHALPIVKSPCWNSQSAASGCRFSSGKLTLDASKLMLDLDKPVVPSDRAGEESSTHASSAPQDPELGVILAKPTQEIDPELGFPRLRERILEPLPLPVAARQPSVYLITRVDYFRTTNVFSGADPVSDGLIRSGLTLFYAPAIGRNTYLVTSIDGNLIRYGRLGFLNYNELRLRAGVLQRLTPRTFGEIGWSSQQLFATKEGLVEAFRGNRFLNDNSIRFELSRQDTLSKKLALNTFYQFRVSFADPNDRSRLINSFISSLSYSWSPSFQTAIDYQLAWSHFTQQSREDVYHQLVGRLTYTITSQSQLNVFSGFSFGHSSDSRINFDGFILGVGVVLNLPLF